MTTLYIRNASDMPHIQDPVKPAQTVCGLPLIGSKQITEKQALVWLGNNRCPDCLPSWNSHNSRLHGGRAA